MRNFYYGNFESKINEKVAEIVSKGSFVKLEYPLNSENISEIASAMASESLFGDKNLYYIDITESEVELIEDFIKRIPANCDLVLVYRDELEKSSKILKIISKDFLILEFKKSKVGNIFSFTDYLLSGDINKTFSELSKLDDNEVLIFNNIVSVARNLLGLKFDLGIKSKIIPFKIGLYKKVVNNFSEQNLIDIYNNLALNDLRFKKGEINGEMLLLHSVNSFFINKNGSTK